MKVTGLVSSFGGPEDSGVSPSEDLALYWEESQIAEHPELFLEEQPPNTTGLARRLDPSAHYLALRWSYEGYTKDELRDALFLVYAPGTGRAALARAVDWGPHEDTARVADISPGLMDALGIETDDEVEVIFPVERLPDPVKPPTEAALRIVISSGHGLYVRGASGFIDEVDSARDVVPAVAEALRQRGCTVYEFNDNVSTTQSENLDAIVDYHNSKDRDLDVSVHFNAYETTEKPMGTECCYKTQENLAASVAAAIAKAGQFVNRGPKLRTDLKFLNATEQPAILIELCFCDSLADTDNYTEHFDAICESIADAIVKQAEAVMV